MRLSAEFHSTGNPQCDIIAYLTWTTLRVHRFAVASVKAPRLHVEMHAASHSSLHVASLKALLHARTRIIVVFVAIIQDDL